MHGSRWLVATIGMAMLAQCAFAAEPVPAAGADGADVRAALARHDLHAAGVAFNRLVERRLPLKQADRPDPVLDRLLVEQIVAQGVQPPRPMLQRLAEDVRAPDRVHNLLLLATAEESAGDATEAARHYETALRAREATADQRLSARLGTARLGLGGDAAAALAQLRAIEPAAVSAARRWELHLLLSRAVAIAEPANTAARDARLADAWSSAPDAGIADHAVARVATDRAVAAARAGDRAKLVTLLAVDRVNRGANAGQAALASDLPVCGEGGVTRDDVAIVEAQRVPPPERPGIGLVWASRPGVGQLFLDAARRSGQLAVSDGAVAQFVLRCRSAPSSDYAVAVKFGDVIGGWMTGKGAYPLSANDGLNPTQLAAMLADRTTRYGTTSIMRLPLLLQMMRDIVPQVAADDGARGRVNDLVSQVRAVLDASNAPADMRLLWRLSSIGLSLAAQAIAPAQAQADVQALLLAAAGNPAVSRDLLYNMATELSGQPTASTELKEAVLTATLKLFDRAPKQDPRARALAIRLHGVRAGNGDTAGARAAVEGRGLSPDLCVLANPMPRYVSSNIRSDDYPGDVVYAAIAGAVPSEFDLDASGQAVDGRLLVSDPPYVFDDVTLAGVRTIRYDPPRRDGKPQACRGSTQTVRWTLPY